MTKHQILDQASAWLQIRAPKYLDPSDARSAEQTTDRAIRRAVLIACILSMVTAAPAAEITKDTLPDGTEHFHIEGTVDRGDERVFERISRGVQRGIVSMVSKGGSVDAATAIGETIRSRNMDTIVGIVQTFGDEPYCYSSCSLIFLGGRKLYSASDATISSNSSFAHKPIPPGEPMFGPYTETAIKYLERLGYPGPFVRFVSVPTTVDDGQLTFGSALKLGVKIFRLSESPFGSPPSGPRKEKKMGD